jgi:hypothetical protein
MQRDSGSTLTYGVILFDIDDNPSTGWACMSNSEPFYFLTPKSLNSNVVWFCNLTISCLQNYESISNLTLYPSDYLFTSFDNIRDELGFSHSTNIDTVKAISEVFEAVMSFHRYYVGSKISTGVSLLNQSIKRTFGGVSYGEGDFIKGLGSEFESKYLDIFKFNCFLKDKKNKILLFHRFEYARNILSRGMPVGQWTRLSPTIMNIGPKPLHKWIITCTKPIVLNVEVTFNDDIARDLFYLNRSRQGCEWVTIDEYKWLSIYADINVKDAIICEGYAPYPYVLPEYTNGLKSSYSFGLYCENIWASICLNSQGELDRSIISMWTIAFDRVQCLQKAYQLEKETSLSVVAYAFGRVVVSYPEPVDGYICRSAFSCNLISPVPSVAFHRKIPESPTMAQFMQIVIERGAISFLQNLDQVGVNDVRDLIEQKTLLSNKQFQNINLR